MYGEFIKEFIKKVAKESNVSHHVCPVLTTRRSEPISWRVGRPPAVYWFPLPSFPFFFDLLAALFFFLDALLLVLARG